MSKRRIPIFKSRYFFDAYLWRDAQAMRANIVKPLPGTFDTTPSNDEVDAQTKAFVCRMPKVGKIPARTWWRWLLLHCVPESIAMRYLGIKFQHTPKLGEIHFYAGCGWNMEVVNHECCHAAITVGDALGINPAFVFSSTNQLSEHFTKDPAMWEIPGALLNDEELFCYINGSIFSLVYRWLWEVDRPKEW